MITLRPAPHTVFSDAIIEVWDDDKFIAAIYPSPRGVKIISKLIDSRDDLVQVDNHPLASTILVNLKRKE